jgi:hypothetical protein
MAVLTLTIVGLSYERILSVSYTTPSRANLSLLQVILVTWGLSFLISSPAFFSYEFIPARDNGSVAADGYKEFTPGLSESRNDSLMQPHCREV